MNNDQEIMNKYNKDTVNENIVCTNEYGFLTDKFVTFPNIFFNNLKNKWYIIIEKYKTDTKKYKKNLKVHRLVSYGIPIPLKYTLWKIFSKKYFLHDYEILKNLKNENVHQIHVDVQRTFRNHFLFCKSYGRGQSELFNILLAFSNFMPNIGYCQGMSNFAAILLMYFPEEEAFEMMVSIIQKNKLDSLFDVNLSKIKKINNIQIELFKFVIPDVLNHLIQNNIDISIYAISWYLTLFTRFEIQYVLRFWDLFLFYDFSIFLFITTSIVKFFSSSILDLKGELLAIFMSKIDTFELDIDYVINESLKIYKKYHCQNYKKKLD